MENFNFNWSLRPILVILSILGVDLSDGNEITSLTVYSQQCKDHNRWLKGCYSLIFFLVNVTAQLASLTLLVFNLIKDIDESSEGSTKMDSTLISYFNMVIDYINIVFFCIACHLILLTSVRQRWKPLIESLHLLENQLAPQFFIKLHRISFLGALTIVLLV